MDVLGKNGDLLLKLMSASVARHDAIASNLANQNVAGYKRQDVAFESLVLEALDSGRDAAAVDMELSIDEETPARADGNNVSPEEEASLMSENRIRFELYAMLLRGNNDLLSQAINGDR